MTITIGLIGHSASSDNLGVGALTVAEVAILRDIAARLGRELKIRILDWTLTRPPYITGPDIEIVQMTGKTLIDPRGYWHHVRGCDLVVDIGAGDSFADIYGPKRLNRMFWMKYLVHLAGKPLVLAPQTYGPFTKALSTRAARGTVKRAALVAARDAKSAGVARDLAPEREVIEASDVALRLPYDAPAPRAAGARPRVGLNVSGLVMGGGYTGGNMFGLSVDYPAMIRALIAGFAAFDPAPEIHLVPHVAAAPGAPSIGVEDDRTASEALAADIPGLVVAPPFESPEAAKSYIAGLDFFAGARMHACIAAFSSGVPVVPMAYSRKFEGLFGTMGYGHTVDCTAESAEEIVARVLAGYEGRAGLASEAAAALKVGQEKLARYEAALEAVIRER
ncbi:MAG: polysaccharide pyruvyl transferase family protein [Pseudomonadota bacterium]